MGNSFWPTGQFSTPLKACVCIAGLSRRGEFTFAFKYVFHALVRSYWYCTLHISEYECSYTLYARNLLLWQRTKNNLLFQIINNICCTVSNENGAYRTCECLSYNPAFFIMQTQSSPLSYNFARHWDSVFQIFCIINLIHNTKTSFWLLLGRSHMRFVPVSFRPSHVTKMYLAGNARPSLGLTLFILCN